MAASGAAGKLEISDIVVVILDQTDSLVPRRIHLKPCMRFSDSAGLYPNVWSRDYRTGPNATVKDCHGPELLETWANSGIFIHKVPVTSHSRSSRRLVSSVVHLPMQYMMENSLSSLHSRMC